MCLASLALFAGLSAICTTSKIVYHIGWYGTMLVDSAEFQQCNAMSRGLAVNIFTTDSSWAGRYGGVGPGRPAPGNALLDVHLELFCCICTAFSAQTGCRFPVSENFSLTNGKTGSKMRLYLG